MTSSRLQLGSLIFGGLLGLALVTGPASATGTTKRTEVSQTGSDSGNCAAGTPCRTFAYALGQTVPGGEMLVLDSGGYGGLAITQAVTINAPPGIIAFVSAPSGDAVTVNAGPTDIVILTGFYLDGYGTGGNGVTVTTTGSFSYNGTITGFTGNPINYVNNAGGTTHLTISNSSFYNNTGPINIKPTAGNVFASIRGLALSSSGIVVDNTAATNSNIGVLFDNSIIRYNSGTAITVTSAGTGFAQVYFDKSQLFNLNTGIVANGTAGPGTGAFVLMNESSAVDITTLVGSGTGAVSSIGNNMVSVGTIGSLGTTSPH